MFFYKRKLLEKIYETDEGTVIIINEIFKIEKV